MPRNWVYPSIPSSPIASVTRSQQPRPRRLRQSSLSASLTAHSVTPYLSSLLGIGKSASAPRSAAQHGGRRIRNRWSVKSCSRLSAAIAERYSCSTVDARGSSVPGPATLRIATDKAVKRVADEKAFMCYQQTMHIAKQWLGSGLITEGDYQKFDTIVAEKFGISARSIWRDIHLIKLPAGGNMPPTKGGISGGTHHSTGSANEAG